MKLDAGKLIVYLLTIFFVFYQVFPILWFFSLSIRTEAEIFSIPPKIVPSQITLYHYMRLFSQFGFGSALYNSLLISISTMLISVSTAALAAYGISRFPFPGSRIIVIMNFFVRMLVPAALIIPLYDVANTLGLIDTIPGVILGHVAWTLPLSFLLLKSYFDEMPVELEEAAAIDGLSPFQTLTRIVLPISLPGLGVAAMFSFWGSWNDFFFSVSLGITKARTGLVALSLLRTTYEVYWGEIAAGGFLYSIPCFLMALLLQKYMVRGLTLGAIK